MATTAGAILIITVGMAAMAGGILIIMVGTATIGAAILITATPIIVVVTTEVIQEL